MKFLRLQFLTLLLSAVSVCAHAQGKVSFTVEAPQTVVAGAVFHISYILNAEVEEGAEPDLSIVHGITATMGPMVERAHSTTLTAEGETRTTTTTYAYYFRADRAGDYTIPVCNLVTRNGTYRSDPLSIQVLPNGEEEESGSSVAPANANPESTAGPGGTGASNDPLPATEPAEPSSEDDASVTPAGIDDAVEPSACTVAKVGDEPAVEEAVIENEIGEREQFDDKTRKILLYCSITLLVLLLAVYISKLGAAREAQYTAQERNGDTATKPSSAWHLMFIAGIIILICCIAVLW